MSTGTRKFRPSSFIFYRYVYIFRCQKHQINHLISSIGNQSVGGCLLALSTLSYLPTLSKCSLMSCLRSRYALFVSDWDPLERIPIKDSFRIGLGPTRVNLRDLHVPSSGYACDHHTITTRKTIFYDTQCVL